MGRNGILELPSLFDIGFQKMEQINVGDEAFVFELRAACDSE